MTLKYIHPTRVFVLIGLWLAVTACQQFTLKDNKEDQRPGIGQITRLLVTEGDSLAEIVHPAALQLSQRLGITYKGARHKAMIQQELPARLKAAHQRGTLQHVIEPLEDGFSRLCYTNDQADSTIYYLQDGLLSSPLFYHTRNWPVREAGYFRFILSDENLLTENAITQLNAFVEECAGILEIDRQALAELKEQKIHYILCSGPEEIEQLTGFRIRGTYILAYDQIVSSFNSHTHEVAHLLINYRLRNLPLYTHPFLQEGFACAVGGRGGKSARIINNLGAFLQLSKFMDYKELLKIGDFKNLDASLSYPLSGIYNLFLLDTLGVEKYLELYRSKSSSVAQLIGRHFQARELPDSSAFAGFAGRYLNHAAQVIPYRPKRLTETLVAGDWGSVAQNDSFYLFNLRRSLRLLPPAPQKDFISIEYREIFPDIEYSGEEYVLEVKNAEVKLFNFYTMKLEAFYSKGLALNTFDVRQENDDYNFAIRRDVFPIPFEQYTVMP